MDISSEEGCSQSTDTDIYLSYDIIDSARDIESNKVSNEKIPESYTEFGYERMCDPASIEEFLKSQGFTVCKQVYSSEGDQDVKKVASMIKRAKVFVACLSDR